jgi:uncharacterized protein (DUF1778 family)
MARADARKEYPLSMRLPARDVDLIDRAATIRGRSRTDFVREAAVSAAEDIVMDQTSVRMSAEGFQAFVKAVAGKGSSVAALVKVLRRKAPWE